MKRAITQSDWIPKRCAKCGRNVFDIDHEDKSIACIYDGWTFYLSDIAYDRLTLGIHCESEKSFFSDLSKACSRIK